MHYTWLILLFHHFQTQSDFLIPVRDIDRSVILAIQLTEIGSFGIERAARPSVRAHLHTGIDIKPPLSNYKTEEPIYPVASGIVISKRTDGPYAQLIIEHQVNGLMFWTLYEHIAEIQVDLFEEVSNSTPIARFFLDKELDQIGWQFNHFHFEILKTRPIEIPPPPNHPERRFASRTLRCFTKSDLDTHFYHPLDFLEKVTKR